MKKRLDPLSILDDLTNGVLALDATDGHIIYVNPACCDILEMKHEELIGKTIVECIESNKINDEFVEYLLRCVSDKTQTHNGEVDYFKNEIKRLQIRTEYYDDAQNPWISMVISDISAVGRMSQMLDLYMSQDVAEMLKTEPGSTLVGGEKRDVSILFSDIRGFTALSEKMDAADLVRILNHYLEPMIKVIHAYDGIITSFLGDGILAVFGAPMNLENHADHAIAAAIDMQRHMREVNNWCSDNNYPELKMGIGIDSGVVLAGNIGCEEHIKYDVIGLTVNTASRIEGHTGGGEILISENTYRAAKGKLDVLGDMDIQAKGISKPLKIYYLEGIKETFDLQLED